MMPSNRDGVLVLIPSLRGGGAERVVATLLKHMALPDLDITLAVVDAQRDVFRDDLPPHVRVIDLEASRVRYAVPKILDLVWRLRPKVVFSTLSHLNLMLAMLRPFFPRGVRFVGRETAVISESLKEKKNGKLWSFAYRRFYRWLDHVVCQSRDMRNDLVATFGFPAGRATIIHNPVDLKKIRQLAGESMSPQACWWDEGQIHLVAAGRLVPQKGFDILLEAVALCRNREIRVSVLGQGALENELKALAETLGVADQVRFLGFQRNPYCIVAKADALLLSSRYEGFPNVVIEALACGTPVIATPAPGGCREILEGLPGCELASSITAISLAEAIQRWLTRERIRIAEDVVAPYGVMKIVGQYEDLILDVASR